MEEGGGGGGKVHHVTLVDCHVLPRKTKDLYLYLFFTGTVLEIIFLYSEDICPFKSSCWSDI